MLLLKVPLGMTTNFFFVGASNALITSAWVYLFKSPYPSKFFAVHIKLVAN